MRRSWVVESHSLMLAEEVFHPETFFAI